MQNNLDLEAYNYELPENHIAQHPADKREDSRLMILDTEQAGVSHKRFSDVIDLLSCGDVLVINDTRVFPARLLGKKETGGKVEVFLLEFPTIARPANGTATVSALIKSSKRPKVGSRITITQGLLCQVVEERGDGQAQLLLEYDPQQDLADILEKCGQIPLPPYINRHEGTTDEDRQRYQTVYANQPGAVAAPTAGLHFTTELLNKVRERGVQICTVTLHVGYGTFAPVREKDITRHQIHSEYFRIDQKTVEAIEETRNGGGKVWAVGTTTVRALEFAAQRTGELEAQSGWCDLYIYPGYQFKVIDNLITNFHLPNSSLLFLVSALCGRKTLLNCYQNAIEKGYRFFSYGDAMAIIAKNKPATTQPE